MDLAEAYDRVTYRGDLMQSAEGERDLRKVVAEVVCRLPEDVQDWLLSETVHVFIGGSGQMGEFMPLCLPHLPETDGDQVPWVRVVFLSEQLMRVPKEEALWTVAHEIAHSYLVRDFTRGVVAGHSIEVEADALAGRWGF